MKKLLGTLKFLVGLLVIVFMLLSVVCAVFLAVSNKENVNKILDENYSADKTEAGVQGTIDGLIGQFSAVQDYKKSLNEAISGDSENQEVSPEVESMVSEYSYSNIIGGNEQIGGLLSGSDSIADMIGCIISAWKVISGEDRNSWLILSLLGADGYFSQTDLLELLATDTIKAITEEEEIKEENIIAFSCSRISMRINTETHYLMLDYIADEKTLDGWQIRYEKSISEIVSENKSDFELLFGRELTDGDDENIQILSNSIIKYMLDNTESPDKSTERMNGGLKVFLMLSLNWYLAAILLAVAILFLLIESLLEKNAWLILSYGAFSFIFVGAISVLVHFLKAGKSLDSLMNQSSVLLYVGIGYAVFGVILIVVRCVIKARQRRKHTEMLQRIASVDIHATPDKKE